MPNRKCIYALLVCAAAAAGQTLPSREWSAGPIGFSGLIDGYYSVNFNHPASRVNQLRAFDARSSQFSLNMAKIVFEHAPEPVGFRVDLGFGRAFETMHAGEAEPGIFRNLQQAYASFKPQAARGLQMDFGKFVTSAGAEVIETHDNWNYSRSLLFTLAIPFYHFGLRAEMPLGKHFSAGAQLVNGWNNVEENNSGKTVGLTGTVNAGRMKWTHVYYFGPEKPELNKGLRHVYDTTVLVTATPKTAFYVNFDYGLEKNVFRGAQRWVGVAGALRQTITPWFALAPRVEWFNDADGWATGAPQKLKEATLTAEFRLRDGFLSRLEYRKDWSNSPFFDRGASLGTVRNQHTVLAGFVAVFGPK
jgi:hypothetical protein